MTYNFKPCSTFFRKRGLALLLACLFSSPAVAGLNDARWDPPARFMGPYHGQLTVKRLPPSAVEGACAQLLGEPYTPGRKRRGCAYVWYKPDRCTIIMIDRPAYGTTPDAVFVHERGHCNGWGPDHPESFTVMSKVKRFLAASLLAFAVPSALALLVGSGGKATSRSA